MRAFTALCAIVSCVISGALCGCDSTPLPAQKMLARIPGCSGVRAYGGNTMPGFGMPPDFNTSEGACLLPSDGDVEIVTWPSWDTSDQQNFVYWNGSRLNGPSTPPDCCLVGTSPVPWAAAITDEDVYAASVRAADWSSVASALGGQKVTNAPPSWNSGDGP